MTMTMKSYNVLQKERCFKNYLVKTYLFYSNRFKLIYMHFRLNRFTSSEPIQRICIESISTHKLSTFSYR